MTWNKALYRLMQQQAQSSQVRTSIMCSRIKNKVTTPAVCLSLSKYPSPNVLWEGQPRLAHWSQEEEDCGTEPTNSPWSCWYVECPWPARPREQITAILSQELAVFFWEQNSKHLRLYRPCDFCPSYSILPLCKMWSSYRQHINKLTWLCSNKTKFMWIDIWIL